MPLQRAAQPRAPLPAHAAQWNRKRGRPASCAPPAALRRSPPPRSRVPGAEVPGDLAPPPGGAETLSPAVCAALRLEKFASARAWPPCRPLCPGAKPLFGFFMQIPGVVQQQQLVCKRGDTSAFCLKGTLFFLDSFSSILLPGNPGRAQDCVRNIHVTAIHYSCSFTTLLSAVSPAPAPRADMTPTPPVTQGQFRSVQGCICQPPLSSAASQPEHCGGVGASPSRSRDSWDREAWCRQRNHTMCICPTPGVTALREPSGTGSLLSGAAAAPQGAVCCRLGPGMPVAQLQPSGELFRLHLFYSRRDNRPPAWCSA